jgi:hypothetical protein
MVHRGRTRLPEWTDLFPVDLGDQYAKWSSENGIEGVLLVARAAGTLLDYRSRPSSIPRRSLDTVREGQARPGSPLVQYRRGLARAEALIGELT